MNVRRPLGVAVMVLALAGLAYQWDAYRDRQTEHRAYAREACALQYDDHLRNAQQPEPYAPASVAADGSDRAEYMSSCVPVITRNFGPLMENCGRQVLTPRDDPRFKHCVGFMAWQGRSTTEAP